MARQQVLDKLKAHQDRLDECAVKSLFMFGSVARDEATSDSDVDFWVGFTRPLFILLGLKAYLEELWGWMWVRQIHCALIYGRQC